MTQLSVFAEGEEALKYLINLKFKGYLHVVQIFSELSLLSDVLSDLLSEKVCHVKLILPSR